MNEQPVIMVQIADPAWTWDVLHAACRLARACTGAVALVQMIRVKHISYLGSELGYVNLKDEDKKNLQLYVDTVEDYGLACTVTLYQYCSLAEAIVGAADLVAASIVYAKLPASRIPLWSACEFELLRVRLSRQHVELFGEPGVWNAGLPKRAAGYTAAHSLWQE
jgi:hypothetical protein